MAAGSPAAAPAGPRRGPTARAPKRVRLSRAPGARLPAGTVSVARPSRFGNPFFIARATGHGCVRCACGTVLTTWTAWQPADVVALYRAWATGAPIPWPGGIAPQGWRSGRYELPDPPTDAEIEAVRGQNVACWCALDAPCHGDVVLELANAPPRAAEAEATAP